MKISLNSVSKRFQRHWIFKDINKTFASPEAYAILGPNGSGKSTLLRLLAGMQPPSKGKISYEDGQQIPADKIYRHVSFCAPSQEIVEEFTLEEFLKFHFSFKKPIHDLTIEDIIQQTGLQEARHKPIAEYSSGMKQRVKLAQAIFSDSAILMLDEPCTNLDEAGVQQYRGWMDEFGKNRLVIVASNDIREYYFCQDRIVMDDYK